MIYIPCQTVFGLSHQEKCDQPGTWHVWAKEPLARPRCRWEDNIKVNLKGKGRGRGLDFSGSRQGQVAGS